MKVLCVLCVFLLTPFGLAAQGMTQETLQVNGVDRTYLLHAPTRPQNGKPLPLVLMLHGAGMTSELMAETSGLNPWADTTGFIVVYPQGLERHWNTTHQPEAGRDDIAFLKALLAKIEAAYSVDSARVFAAGFSNGAEFVQELGCRDDFHFAAILSVSATLQEEDARLCAPKHTVRLIQFHGTADPIVPYLGGRVVAPNGPLVVSVADDLQIWAKINHCAPNPRTERLADNGDTETHIERVSFPSCAAGGEVTHYRIVGGGHTWPGNPNTPKRLGQTTRQIDASRYLAHLISANPEP
jgi:polyhydroxybutyrate depolymerase